MTDPIGLQHQEPRRNLAAINRFTPIAGLVCAVVLVATLVTGCGSVTGAPGASGSDGRNSAGNTTPAIQEVAVASERIRPGDLVQLECRASDEDGDKLDFAWSAGHGDIIGTGATVEWVAPSTEGLFRVSVTVDDGRGGTAERAVSLTVKSNSAPEFQSAPSFAQGVRPGAAVQISCPAVDADGDEIAYEWQAAFGELRGQRDTVTWVAPASLGSYVVTAVARDAYGGESRRDVLISVTPSLTPKLGEFKVEPIEHDRLRYELGVWDIYIGESCRIECVVLEGDGPFTYAWTVDEGVLKADGAVATWTAPTVRGPATIKVAVTDAQGNTNSGQLLMYAEDCTCAFD